MSKKIGMVQVGSLNNENRLDVFHHGTYEDVETYEDLKRAASEGGGVDLGDCNIHLIYFRGEWAIEILSKEPSTNEDGSTPGFGDYIEAVEDRAETFIEMARNASRNKKNALSDEYEEQQEQLREYEEQLREYEE